MDVKIMIFKNQRLKILHEGNHMHGFISDRFHEIVIYKQQHANSVSVALISAKLNNKKQQLYNRA